MTPLHLHSMDQYVLRERPVRLITVGLLALMSQRTTTIQELCEQLGRSRSAIGRQLTQLVHRNLLRRTGKQVSTHTGYALHLLTTDRDGDDLLRRVRQLMGTPAHRQPCAPLATYTTLSTQFSELYLPSLLVTLAVQRGHNTTETLQTIFVRSTYQALNVLLERSVKAGLICVEHWDSYPVIKARQDKRRFAVSARGQLLLDTLKQL